MCNNQAHLNCCKNRKHQNAVLQLVAILAKSRGDEGLSTNNAFWLHKTFEQFTQILPIGNSNTARLLFKNYSVVTLIQPKKYFNFISLHQSFPTLSKCFEQQAVIPDSWFKVRDSLPSNQLMKKTKKWVIFKYYPMFTLNWKVLPPSHWPTFPNLGF